jgi:hypothetical protein
MTIKAWQIDGFAIGEPRIVIASGMARNLLARRGLGGRRTGMTRAVMNTAVISDSNRTGGR